MFTLTYFDIFDERLLRPPTYNHWTLLTVKLAILIRGHIKRRSYLVRDCSFCQDRPLILMPFGSWIMHFVPP